MGNVWFRLYAEFADDPKVISMPEPMQLRLVKLFCLRCKDETLDETLQAFQWRITSEEMKETKKLFLSRGFIDDEWNLLNWNRRQFLSDSSTERVRQYRERKKRSETLHREKNPDDIISDVTGGNVTVTAPEQIQIQNQSRTETEKAERESRAKARESGTASAVNLRTKIETLHETLQVTTPEHRVNPLGEDVADLVRQIVCAYPKSLLRSLVDSEVRPSEEQAVVVALIAEQGRQGGTERSIAGWLLERTRKFASRIPEAQWRFLPKVQDFFSGLEYRREPEEMIHARNGGGNGSGNGRNGKGSGTDGNQAALREFLADRGESGDVSPGDRTIGGAVGGDAQPGGDAHVAAGLRGADGGPDAIGGSAGVFAGARRGAVLAHAGAPKRAQWP